MVAEFASPRPLAAIADSLPPIETNASRNAASTEPSKREQATARLEALLEHCELPEGSEQDLWTAFQGLINVLDDEDFVSLDKPDAIDVGENALGTVLAFPEGADASMPSALLPHEAEAQSSDRNVTGDSVSSMGQLLPFRSNPVEAGFDSTPTWHEVIVAFGLEIQRLRKAQGLSLDQIRFKTQIPVYQLQALESGAVEQLPEEIFVRGFLKRICGQLGEEGQALLEQMPEPKQEQQEILAQWQLQGANSSPQVVHLQSAHLYVGYAALLASAAGGLAWSFQETAPVKASPDAPQPTAQRSGARARLNPALRANKLAFGTAVAQPELFVPELTP